jgi:hypothetical protein
MAIFRAFEPEVDQIVLMRNHLGFFRSTEIDPATRTVSVRILRSGTALQGIPWELLAPWDDETQGPFKKAFGRDSE